MRASPGGANQRFPITNTPAKASITTPAISKVAARLICSMTGWPTTGVRYGDAQADARCFLWMTCSTYSPLSCLVAAMRRFQALIVAIETTSAASCGSL